MINRLTLELQKKTKTKINNNFKGETLYSQAYQFSLLDLCS